MLARGFAQLAVPASKSRKIALGEGESTGEVDGISAQRMAAGHLGGGLDQRVRHFVNVESRPDRIQLVQGSPSFAGESRLPFRIRVTAELAST